MSASATRVVLKAYVFKEIFWDVYLEITVFIPDHRQLKGS